MQPTLRYIVSGKPPTSWRQTLFVHANSCDEAVKQLRDNGWTKLVLHTNEMQAATDSVIRLQGSAYLVSQAYRGGWAGYLSQVLTTYQKSWWLLLLCLAYFFWLQLHHTFHWELIALCFLPIFLPGILGLILPNSWMIRRLNKLINHQVYGRYDQMYQVAKSLDAPVPEWNRRYLCAIALAGLQRVEEADDEFKLARKQILLPEWMMLFLLSGIYITAKQFKRADELELQLQQMSPGNVAVILTHGIRLYLVNQDTKAASVRVKEAMPHEIADNLLPYFYFLQGAVAMDGNQLEEADRLFKQADMATSLFRALPETKLTFALIRSHQALLWARQGDHSRANRAFAFARPILESRGSHQLLDRCRKELGVI